MHKTAILDEISSSKDYEYVLMTSFTFDINFFEQAILNKFTENNIKKIALFIDLKKLNENLSSIRSASIGKKYSVTPYDMSGSFHPKIILFLGKEKAKVIIGSSNITASGYVTNNEVFNTVEYTGDENLYLIQQAIDFFLSINEKSLNMEKELFVEITKLSYYQKKAKEKLPCLVHSLNESVISGTLRIIKEEIESVDIAVPYYDKTLNALKELKLMLPNAKFNLYIQNDRSTFPVAHNESIRVASNEEIKVFSKITATENSNFYHGKVFRFQTKTKEYILYGSSNCTGSGIIKSYENGGNVECNVLEDGELLKYDYFFSNFPIIKECNLKSEVLHYEANDINNFSFKHGVLTDRLKLTMGYKNKQEELRVLLFENELNYKYDGKELIIEIPKFIAELESDIFEIKLIFDKKEEVIKCWYNDIDAIAQSRESETVKQIKNINFEYENENYVSDIRLLITAMAMNNIELKKVKEIQKKKYLKQDIPEESDDEDFIVDFDFPDEYVEKERNFKMLETVRKNVVTYFHKKVVNDKKTKKRIKKSDSDKDSGKTSKPTTEEVRFSRFLKSRIKGMFEEEYFSSIDWQHFYENIIVIMSIFEKYSDKDLFEENYVINVKADLLEKLLDKEQESIDDESIELLVYLVLRVIIENHFANLLIEERDYKVELKNKELLEKLNDVIDIREEFENYVDLMFERENNNFNVATNYIEKLFGYKTKNKLMGYIKYLYGDETTIEINDDKISIEFNTCELKHHFKENINLLKELKSYAIKDGRLKVVKIKINNAMVNNSFPNPPLYIEFLIDINNGQSKRTIFSKNGDRQEVNNHLRDI